MELFQSAGLANWLANRLRRARARIAEATIEELAAGGLIDELAQMLYVEPLELAGAGKPELAEAQVTIRGQPGAPGPWGADRSVPGTRITFRFPFTGDRTLWSLQPSSFILRHARGDLADEELVLHVEFPGPDSDPDFIAGQLEMQLTPIRTILANSQSEVVAFNSQINEQLDQARREREDWLSRQGAFQKALGIPLVREEEAPRPIPMERKILGPKRRHALPAQKRTAAIEYELTEADYEDVLEIILGVARAFERTPRIAALLREEERLRDIFLLLLNGTYKGQATGETFVRSGKTDILVTMEDKHVFVGECKWWTGPKAFGKAIDQLLRYLPWRDEKAALILFIRTADVSRSIEAADAAVCGHSAFRHLGKAATDPTARRNYVLAHPTDEARTISLALVIVALDLSHAGT